MKLDGTVTIVTGGGRGIGRTIALRFAAEGSAVVVSGTSKDKLEATSKDINEGGGRALALLADVADESQVQKLVADTIKQFGRVDILINNSGIAGPTALVHEIKREDWDQTLAVNLTGCFLCSKHVVPHLIAQRSGRIINITSIAGLKGYAWRSPYCSSKWAMIGFTRTLAEEVGKYGVTVNAIAPGAVRGPRIDEVIRNRAEQTGRPVAEVEKDYVEPTALKRMVEEEDIASMALYLCGEEGRNITGETINISSGYRIA